jgi:hypothetical protein
MPAPYLDDYGETDQNLRLKIFFWFFSNQILFI